MPEVKEKSLLVLSAPPHIKSNDSINKIMWTVAAVLMLPVTYSIYIYGLNAALIPAVCAISGVSAEAVFQFLMKRKIQVLNGSSVITGLLLGLSLPPHFPLWMSAIGTVFAVVVIKEFFGGLGFNIFNPALAGRALLMVLWPVQMTSNWHIFSNGSILAEKYTTTGNLTTEAFHAITQATPLSALKNGGRLLQESGIAINNLYDFFISNSILKSLIIGNVGGCIGETSAIIIFICGLFLLWRKIITWYIPVSFIGSVALVSYVYYSISGFTLPGYITLFHIFSGGLLLGAFFMATDMVTSPISASGMIIFGIGCGLITFSIRIWGGYPEGAAYAILIMNAVVPLIDRYTQHKVFGV